MIRFHLDQHVATRLADALRRRGVDVTTTYEAGLQDASDEEHLAFALKENRVIVTHDKDFLVRHSQGVKHAGICYCHQHTRSIGDLLDTLMLIHECLDPDELLGRVEYL